MATRDRDAFGRVPVSDPETLFDSAMQYNAQPLVLDAAGANPIALSVVLTGIGGTPVGHAALTWRELY